MQEKPINTEELWDAEAYYRSGKIPWTIFAYPVSLADSQRLPRDDEARRYLSTLHSLGLPVGIWDFAKQNGTIYFACPGEERDRVHAAIDELEQEGVFPPRFASQKCEAMFSLDESAIKKKADDGA